MSDKDTIRSALLDAARRDDRIVAVVDYGATARGCGDAWSDIDVVIYLTDASQDHFAADWTSWVAKLGPILLAYDAGGHPRAIFDTPPYPTRMDFGFFAASRIAEISDWPLMPASVDSMVLLDKTPDGAFCLTTGKLLGRLTQPLDLQREFQHVSGDLWYYLLRVFALLARGDTVAARTEYHWFVLGNLAALARLESGVTGRWRVSLAAAKLRDAVSPARLAQIERCVPGADADSMRAAARESIRVGSEMCQLLAARRNWLWPVELAAELSDMFKD